MDTIKIRRVVFYKKKNYLIKDFKKIPIKQQILVKNIFPFVLNFFFKKNLKLKFLNIFLKIFSFILNFLFIKVNKNNKDSNNNTLVNYFYYTFIKKNFHTNK